MNPGTLFLRAFFWLSCCGPSFPTLENGFIGYDDPEYVTGNAHVQQGLTLQNVRWAFCTSAASNWHPVTWLSHMVDCDLFGVHAWGHHLTSILLHAANTILVFYLLVGWSQTVWASFLVAILFGIHPLRVESVAWVSERKDVLSGLFFLLTLLVYSKFGRERKQNEAEEFRLAATGAAENDKVVKGWRIYAGAYGWSFLLFVVGLLAKPMLVTVPFILLLLDFWPLRRWSKRALPRLLMEKLPFVAAACAVGIVTILVQQHGGAMQLKIPPGLRLENAIVSYTRYIAKLIYPSDLAVFYPYPTHWPLLVVLVALALIAGITAVAFWLRRTQPFFVVGWLWFVGMLVPVIGILQVGEQALADRYTYLPSIGILMALVLGAFSMQLAGKLRFAGTMTICAVIALACGLLTRHQLGYWRDSRTLFSHALAVTRGNPLAHNNLGTALDQAGEVEQAIYQYRLALQLKPSFALAHNNLGTALDRQGKLQDAVKEFIAALEINPFYAEVHHNLAVTLMKMGLVDDAIREVPGGIKNKTGLCRRTLQSRHRIESKRPPRGGNRRISSSLAVTAQFGGCTQ